MKSIFIEFSIGNACVTIFFTIRLSIYCFQQNFVKISQRLYASVSFWNPLSEAKSGLCPRA